MEAMARTSGKAPAAGTANHMAALLDWWRLSGVDMPTRDAPRNWLRPASRDVTGAAAVAVQSAKDLPASRAAAPAEPLPAEDWSGFSRWQDLVASLRADWPQCPVIDGNPESGILLVGEAPSAEDLRTGRPFSGPAGQMLDRMLAAIDLDRTRCAVMLLAARRRVPGSPPPDAIARDLPMARQLIALIAPRHMLLLGKIPTHALTQERDAIGALRGRWLDVGTTPALATYNPAYLLRTPSAKADAWADLLAFRRRMAS